MAPELVEMIVRSKTEERALKVANQFIQEGDCIVVPMPWPAELLSRDAGPMRGSDGDVVSVWAVHLEGIPDPVWVLLRDTAV